MASRTRVSILMPCYNGASVITQSLNAAREALGRKGELIVVDDGSSDGTPKIAEEYADKVVCHSSNLGLREARKRGMRESKGEILVNIDSDVLVPPHAISTILNFFQKNPEVVALTGLLSKQHPNQDFFSQYKNLYMYYTFYQLPDNIYFVYGSIFAIRREVAHFYGDTFEFGEDTVFGQRLVKEGKKIAFLKDLEVIHLKKYNLISFVKNDFRIPFNWAKIFWKYGGWKQLGRNKTGFVHASKEQLTSVVLTSFFLTAFFLIPFNHFPVSIIFFLSLVWFLLNLKFFKFLKREKGFWFSIRSVLVTFFDQWIMAAGILCGTIKYFFEIWKKDI